MKIEISGLTKDEAKELSEVLLTPVKDAKETINIWITFNINRYDEDSTGG